MAFMGGLAGLGAAPGGFVDMTRKLTEEDQRQQELLLGGDKHLLNQQALTRGQFGLAGASDDVAGTEALGRALAAAGMSPDALTGGPGPQGPGGSMAMPPGAPSTPSIGPSAGTPPGSPIGDRFGTWDQTNTPAGLPATVPGGGGQINGSQSPSAPAGGPPPASGGTPPGTSPPGTGTPGGGPPVLPGGGFDLQSVAAKILQANPGIEKNPRIFMSALTKAAPLLNQQAKMELAQARLQLQSDSLDLRSVQAQRQDETKRDLAAPDTKAFNSFMAQNPNATAGEQAQFRQSLRAQGGPSATQLKLDETARRIDVVDGVVTDALQSLKTGYQNGDYLTGVGGKTQRVSEVLANLSGWSDKTAANNFAQKLELLKTMAPQILAGTARTSKDERARVDRIIRGLDVGDTSQITVADLQYLQNVVKQLRPATSGAKTAPQQGGTTPGGIAQNSDAAFRTKAKAEGYTDEQIDAFLKARKK